MQIPLGFNKKGETRVCKINKSLYGLNQASRQWFAKLFAALLNEGFTQSHADYSLFTLRCDNFSIFVLIYVDDIIITGDSESKIASIK